VSDLVDGIVRAQFTEGTTGEVFNLGNPDEHSVREYAEIINRMCGSRSEIVNRPFLSADDPQRRRPDIAKARAQLGWEPKVGLEEGLARTIAWFRERLGVAVHS
jgi:nucleoside-diphosphate-sugar epimerase